MADPENCSRPHSLAALMQEKWSAAGSRWFLRSKLIDRHRDVEAGSALCSGTNTRWKELAIQLFEIDDDEISKWPGIKAYLARFQCLENSNFGDLLKQFLGSGQELSDGLADHLQFFKDICRIFKRENSDEASIDDILEFYCEESGIDHGKMDDVALLAGRQCIFYTLMTMGMIYQPVQDLGGDTFVLEQSLSLSEQSRRQRIIKVSKRPITGLVRAFGNLRTGQGTVGSRSGLLYSSSLSFDTLLTIGKIRIQWTDMISAHLTFSPSSRTLLLYRLPTTCALVCLAKNPPVMFARLFLGFIHTDEQMPGVDDYFREILLSYRLIFGQHAKARALFRSLTESIHATQPETKEDELLHTLCTKANTIRRLRLPSSLWPSSCVSFDGRLLEQDVYSVEIDFPLLGPRLEQLQAFNLRQQPRRIRDLWRDRRNPLQWYTFWAVIVVGGLTILLAILQLFVSIAQLARE